MRISDWSSDVCSSDLDAAGKGRGALAVEIAFEAVTDRFVEQQAGPAGAEHHRHLAGWRRDGFEVHQCLGECDVDRAVPGPRLEQIAAEVAHAEAMETGLAPPVLLDHDLDVETPQRANAWGTKTSAADEAQPAPPTT